MSNGPDKTEHEPNRAEQKMRLLAALFVLSYRLGSEGTHTNRIKSPPPNGGRGRNLDEKRPTKSGGLSRQGVAQTPCALLQDDPPEFCNRSLAKRSARTLRIPRKKKKHLLCAGLNGNHRKIPGGLLTPNSSWTRGRVSKNRTPLLGAAGTVVPPAVRSGAGVVPRHACPVHGPR